MIGIEAPSNLGLKPPREGHEPGTWRAPEVLREAGLFAALGVAEVRRLHRPRYSFEPPDLSRIRNGPAIREFSELLAKEVGEVLRAGEFPLVVGGDCSILLGCLAGARSLGECGLVHIDGHSDFSHPGNYDPSSRLGNAAGMDLALATGRGEPLLTVWEGAGSCLVPDRYVAQIGERENHHVGYEFGDLFATEIISVDIGSVLEAGVAKVAESVVRGLRDRGVRHLWLHVDVDVLDERVMPAVDCPGSPGLSGEQLAEQIRTIRRSTSLLGMEILGADVTVFDPELDPDGGYARNLVDIMKAAFRD